MTSPHNTNTNAGHNPERRLRHTPLRSSCQHILLHCHTHTANMCTVTSQESNYKTTLCSNSCPP